MKLKIFQVDAFTDTAYGGNPAGVVPLIDEKVKLNENQMQKIAREINCAETAFITLSDNPIADYKVRFFTPKEEVDLCGHATIASFWLLAEKGYIEMKEPVKILTQETKAGILPLAIYSLCGKIQKVMMLQSDPKFYPALDKKQKSALAKILGLSTDDFYIPSKPIAQPVIVSTGLSNLLVPVKDLETLKTIKPDFNSLSSFSKGLDVISVHAFTFDTFSEDSTVCCRNFGPRVGINEESATGTASGALGAYLTAFGFVPIKKPTTKIICEQGFFMDRPSRIEVEIDITEVQSAHSPESKIIFPNSENVSKLTEPRRCSSCCSNLQHDVEHFIIEKVKVGGKAVTVIEGDILI
ncbi:MAG: trans-2,3-dihydro-3-hydroxyanthranilate isomerase [Thermosediminibacterales bacterium]|nr:trans-2,3-dihydro-3-hydroxyanthranilate isomerase [Thermosediminibacterales bacterium]MDK2835857.1 trans-2,3-dihydro-3-hydroxyanthranilate isomerase [Thermosediminibacterales bacterium]